MNPLHKGQKVRVQTVDHGRLPTAWATTKPLRTEIWVGTVVGRSVLGDDLWLVKVLGRGKGGTTYTVPRREILA